MWIIVPAVLFLVGTSATLTEAQFIPSPNCVCIRYQNCLINGSVNTFGAGVIDIRLGEDSNQKNNSCHFLDTCCNVPDIDNGTRNPNQNQNPANPGNNNNNNNNNQSNYTSRGCGYRNTEGIGFRIVGNTDGESQFAEFPWMVAVFDKDPETNKKRYACGGSLVHPRVVLTAAHCVYKLQSSEVAIRAGEWDTQTESEPLRHQDRDVTLVIRHPEYKDGVLHNDFALLILKKPLNLAPNVDTICLPAESERFDNTRCTVTGWGKDRFARKGRYQSILKSLDLPTVPFKSCESMLQKTDLSRYFILHESFMCAGGEADIDACQGDGGSPLVCPMPNSPGRYVQAGIVAWGIGCGKENVPGVYASLPRASAWIKSELAIYNINV